MPTVTPAARRLISSLMLGSLALGVATAAPSATAAGPCLAKVTKTRTTHQVLASGAVFDQFSVRVTRDGRTQTDTVQRVLLPPGAKPRLLTQPLGGVRPIRDQVKARAPHALAAVNGDFFYVYSTGRARVILPSSASVTGGGIVRADDEPMRVVGIDVTGRPYAGTLAATGTVTRANDTFRISGVNWHYLPSGGVTVFTNRWGSGDLRPAGAVEWVVRDGHIAEVRTGSTRGASVTAGTRVVAFGSNHADAARRARVGDPADVVVTQSTAGGVRLAEAVGRGIPLVNRGSVVVPCSGSTLEARPRNSVGWTATGRWATLSTLGDGYDSNGYRYGGLGLAHEANVAVSLGLVSAYQLDGGGSVTTYVRRSGGVWDRIDDVDWRYQRSVPNGLAFVRG